MATALTRDTLVSYSGKRAGNESLATFGNDWLNNIIDTLGQAYKWPELEQKTTGSLAAFVAGGSVPEISLPADFGDLWDAHGLSLIDSNSGHHTLVPETWDWFDLITAPTLSVGEPKWAAFNLNSMKWSPYPMPGQAYTWQLRYRIKPSRLSSNTTIPFANDDIFIQALFVQILQYEDDERAVAERAVLDQMIARYLGGYNKSPIKQRKIRLNTDTFKGIQSYR